MAFNLVGYKAVFSYLQRHANNQMVEKLDKLIYDKANLTEVKIPLHLPYPANDKDFERYDGSIDIDGVTYNYVERKRQNDTLILHCINNTAANNIKKAGKAYDKSMNDFQPVQKGEKNNNTTTLLLKVLECTGYRFTAYASLNNMLHTVKCTSWKSTSETIVSDNFSQSPEQPPDMA